MNYAWITLLIAGFFEIFMILGLKYADGFTKLWPSIFTLIVSTLSFYLLAQSVKTIPIGTAYAVWTGIGVAGSAISGFFLFHESLHLLRIACLFLIILGVIGLKLIES